MAESHASTLSFMSAWSASSSSASSSPRSSAPSSPRLFSEGLEYAAGDRSRQKRGTVEEVHSPRDSLIGQTTANTNASWTKAGFLVANLIVGSGIFTTPFGFVAAGWSAILLGVAASAVATWTALLIGDLLEAVESPEACSPPTYNTVGERAFGRAFLPFFGAFSIGQCLLQGVYMISLSAESWHASVQLPVTGMIYANAAVCLCITIVPRRYFAIIAKLGVAITLAAVAVVIASGLSLLPDEVDGQQSYFGRGIAGIPSSLAAVILSCGDHVCFPDVYHATGCSKRTYKKGIIMGFAIFLGCMLFFCVPCYMTFGTSIKPNVLTNIGLNARGDKTQFPSWLGVATNAFLAFRFLFIIPCFMPCIFVALDAMAGKVLKMDLSDSANLDSIIELLPARPCAFVVCLTTRIIGYAILVCCATFFETYLGALVTIVGSLFQSVNVIILPCLAYYKLCPEKLQGRYMKTACLWLILVIGMIWCVGGTYIGVMDVASGKKA